MLNNIKLTSKIVIVVATAILGMLIISTSTYLGLTKIGKEIEEIADYQVPINTLITELEKDILEEEILTYRLMLESSDVNSEAFKKLKSEIVELEKLTEKTIIEVEDLIQEAIAHNKDSGTKQTYQLFFDEVKELEKEQMEFVATLNKFETDLKNNDMEHIEKDKKLLHEELSLMDTNIQTLMQQMERLLESSTTQAKKDEMQILTTIEIIATCALILSIIFSTIIIRNIKTTIASFQDGLLGFFKYLNRESDTVTPLNAKGKDEIAIMATVVNENIEKTKINIDEDRRIIDESIKVLSEFEQGDLTQRVHTHSSNPTLQKLTTLLNQMGDNLEKNIDDILEVLEKYSNYDYTSQADAAGLKKHLLRLTEGINNLGKSITQMLLESKSNGLTMEKNAKTLVDNVELLNNNSTNTATALEETAAALEEITATIGKNAETIAKMNEHATTVKRTVTNSQTHATNTNESMDKLHTQVNAINDAVVFIDQIAFQTNILSLNAAVEAATAGEAGKGFAVVAQEVRNLASRAADAAKEIKDLIESATLQAEEGKKIADDMMAEYCTLFESIEENTQLIDHVAQASKEQKGGIEQINEAVTELDRQSQQNLSIAHSTQTIAEQTDSLSNMIVEDANSKEFHGKHDVSIKAFDDSQPKSKKSMPVVTAPVHDSKAQETKAKSTPPQMVNHAIIKSEKHDESEWESF